MRLRYGKKENDSTVRAIRFRGIALNDDLMQNWRAGSFVYGSLLMSGEEAPVIVNDDGHHIPVKAGTVGQFIGVKDIHGAGIYEDDIVRWGHIAGYEELVPRLAVVEFTPEIAFRAFNLGENNHRFGFSNFAYRRTDCALEVVGNRYHNVEIINKHGGYPPHIKENDE